MTLNQLEYLIALNHYRHFGKAAEASGISQPTLSLMIKKIEQELDVEIFDRSKQPLQPTEMGMKILQQAEKSIKEIGKITELIQEETGMLSGPLHIGIIPTLAPYIIPDLIRLFKSDYPEIQLKLTEMNTKTLIQALKDDELDLFIAATPLEESGFYEIPLYYEKFVAYFASGAMPSSSVSLDTIPKENLWVLEEGHCLRDQTFNFCGPDTGYNQVYEAGSIETLIKIVDTNGGYSIIPELQIPLLTPSQRENLRDIDNPPANREVSIIIKKGFIKERMLNAVADSIKKIIPESMLDNRLKKFRIKL
ncbi:hydrogen peroxide-inducible genes activator [Flavobacteriaceae bacterium]|nr:hydrogen peroxide-inducible genes activator [Flavobacteriaceae bacterium]